MFYKQLNTVNKDAGYTTEASDTAALQWESLRRWLPQQVKFGNFDALFGFLRSLWIYDTNHDIIEESLGLGSVLLSGIYQKTKHYLTEHLTDSIFSHIIA